MSALYEKLVRPLMFRLDAETAHEMGIESLRLGLSGLFAGGPAVPFGKIERFGLSFSNPIGVAAGFDKNGVVVNQLESLGFGFVEVGTVTLKPQKGNPKPRLFRLPEDQALINRLGFNNDGAEVVADRLRKLERKCVVGVNIGKNKDVPNEEAVENYVACLDIVHDVADYVAVNISSPNTPGLRDLQRGENLENLVGALMARISMQAFNAENAENAEVDERGAPQSPSLDVPAKPLLVKIAPDLSEPELEEIVDICLRNGIAGIIATNTTVARDGLRTANVDALGAGGLSGRPLTSRSNQVISKIYGFSNGQLPIIGVGGIFTARDAFDKIAAGACLVQAYTGFVYGGPSFARDIAEGLRKLLEQNGFASIDDAIGSGVNAG